MATKGKKQNRDEGSLTMSLTSVSFGPSTKQGLHNAVVREWRKLSKASLKTELARALHTQSPGHFCILFSKSLSSLPSL